MIIKKLTLKPDATEQDLITLTNYLDGLGKFVSSDMKDGRYVVMAKFDDEMDATAFSVFAAQAKGAVG